MDKNVKKAVTEAINMLDWDMIANFYGQFDMLEAGQDRRQKLTVSALKKELRGMATTMVDHGLTEIASNLFKMSMANTNMGLCVEILFTPTRGLGSDKGRSVREKEMVETEKTSLQKLLDKAVKEEDYDLACVLRDQIKKLNKDSVEKTH